MDLIDRQDAIGTIQTWLKHSGYSEGERNVMGCTIQMLEGLPSAQKNDEIDPNDDLIKRQDAIDAVTKYCTEHDLRDLLADLEVLPSAQKTGKWIWVQYDSNPEIGNWHCSVCRFMPASFNLAKKHLNYCPNCGAYMRGEEE